MRLELLTIGTELLLGLTIDTNSAELGRALADAGIRVTRRASVSDQPGEIRAAVEEALTRTGAVLCTGGLGPTADDVTKNVVAELFGMPLEFRPELWANLVARFARFGRTPAEKNRAQAEVPVGATVLPNRWGTAPGLWFETDARLAILLPGVPSEMRNLLRHEVLPRLASRAGTNVVRSATLRTTGIPESSLAERLTGIEQEVDPLSLAYLPGSIGVDLRLTAWNLPPATADSRLAQGIAALRSRAAGWAYGEGEADLAGSILDLARSRGWTLATAESCTGGGLGERITGIPGSSEVFLGGVIAYRDTVKQAMLGVLPATLLEHGAVSEATAREMAAGVTRLLQTDLGIALTGIAGPGGGSPEKPVGLVYVATAIHGSVEARRFVFPGDRAEIRARAAQAALFFLWQRLSAGVRGTSAPTS